MSETNIYLLIIIAQFILLLIYASGRSYWMGKYESLYSERPDDGGGWREEARFLRRLFNSEAAKEAEENHW